MYYLPVWDYSNSNDGCTVTLRLLEHACTRITQRNFRFQVSLPLQIAVAGHLLPRPQLITKTLNKQIPYQNMDFDASVS